MDRRRPLHSLRKKPMHLEGLSMLLLCIILELLKVLLNVAKVLAARVYLIEYGARDRVHLAYIISHSEQ